MQILIWYPNVLSLLKSQDKTKNKPIQKKQLGMIWEQLALLTSFKFSTPITLLKPLQQHDPPTQHGPQTGSVRAQTSNSLTVLLHLQSPFAPSLIVLNYWESYINMDFPFINSEVFQENKELYGYIVIKSVGPVTATKCWRICTRVVLGECVVQGSH